MSRTGVLCIAFIAFLGLRAVGQEKPMPLAKGFSLGFQIAEHQRDFGLGINLLSPHFARDRMALRLRANLMWLEHATPTMVTTWTGYPQVSLGVVGYAGTIGHRVRLYGEGGPLALFPSREFATSGLAWGGYGLFGFEFFISPNSGYFLEIGGVGTNARADRIVLKPLHSNGLLVQVGFRYQF